MTTSFRPRLARALCGPLPPIVAQRVRSAIYPVDRARRYRCAILTRGQTGSWLRSLSSDDHGYVFSVHGYYDWRI